VSKAGDGRPDRISAGYVTETAPCASSGGPGENCAPSSPSPALEIGRPPGAKPGTSFKAPLAIQIALPLSPGSYRWEVFLDGHVEVQESFDVVRAPMGSGWMPYPISRISPKIARIGRHGPSLGGR
jgi:hypothetical protein